MRLGPITCAGSRKADKAPIAKGFGSPSTAVGFGGTGAAKGRGRKNKKPAPRVKKSAYELAQEVKRKEMIRRMEEEQRRYEEEAAMIEREMMVCPSSVSWILFW
jgi:hypothetical protein